jgi:hypothetical protein
MAGSPKITEYIGHIAPAEKKALYMGYSFIPVFLGTVFAGIISGNIYQAMSDKVSITERFVAENGLQIPDGLSTGAYFQDVARQVKMSPQALTDHLWDTYHPSSIWVIIFSIGVTSVLCLFLYDRISSRKAGHSILQAS